MQKVSLFLFHPVVKTTFKVGLGLVPCFITAEKIVDLMAVKFSYFDRFYRSTTMVGFFTLIYLVNARPYTTALFILGILIVGKERTCTPTVFIMLLENKYSFFLERVTVIGDVDLSGKQITTLPRNLTIKGYLKLDGSAIQRLPENLTVHGDLSAEGSDLEFLPQRPISLKGNLLLNNCTRLKDVPSWIARLAPNRSKRVVDLTFTSIQPNRIKQLQRLAKGFTPIVVREIFFESLEEASKAYGDQWTSDNLPEEHITTICRFLWRLHQSSEYQNADTRDAFKQRVHQLVMYLKQKPSTTVMVLVGEGAMSCPEKAVYYLNEIELALMLLHYKPSSEAEFRKLGRQFYLLKIIDQQAILCLSELKRTQDQVDEVQVCAYIRCYLSLKFDLPLKTTVMTFPGAENLSDDMLSQAERLVREADTPAALDAYLSSWEPWLKFQRERAVVRYEDLRIDQSHYTSTTCTITDETLTQPIIYDGLVYNYANFIRLYIEQGTDPYHRNKKIDISMLKRIEIEGSLI
jgi:hypothetical protein